jgi:uncharacterized protein YndB with AHSA1/START domain
LFPASVGVNRGTTPDVPTNEIDIAAPADQVWSVLLDPRAYVEWVVGGRTFRGVDPDWPQPGAAFHHTAGVRPFVVKDKTKVVALQPPHRIVLEARARPVGIACVVLTVDPGADGGCSHVTMEEEPIAGPLRLVPRALLDPLVRARNAEALRRLRALVEERVGTRA